MRRIYRPHVLGVDDGPFTKHVSRTVPVVGVMMEGADLVEGVAVTEVAVDGEDMTGFLGDWIVGLRLRPALQGVLFGSVTIAGLGVIDIRALAARLGIPALIVNRKDPGRHRLRRAFATAGLPHRMSVVESCPAAFPLRGGPFVAVAGVDRAVAVPLVRSLLNKSDLPEPLRVAHLIARAVVSGESRGRP